MPSKIVGSGHYYARAGGAYKKTASGGFKKVGSGKGKFSKRSLAMDRSQKAQKGTYKQKRKYPQSYD